MLISVPEAGRILGLKGRSSLYRKIDSGELPVVRDQSGKPKIEREGLEDLWRSINRLKSNSPMPLRSVEERTRPRPARPAPPPADDGEVPNFNEERARHEREKRLLAELARQEKERQLLPREDVEQAWNQAVNLTRTKLLGVASTVKQRIPHLEPEEVTVIRELIREALEELASGQVAA